MANLTSALRRVAVGVAVMVASAGQVWAKGPEQTARLVDHDSRVAVFSFDGELHAVEAGQRLPSSQARLVAVSDLGVRLEYPASADSLGGILLLERGDQVPEAWPAPERPAEAIPVVTVKELPAGSELPLVLPETPPEPGAAGDGLP